MIYSLNTKNDDLEYDMEAMRVAYEDKLQKVKIGPASLLIYQSVICNDHNNAW